MALGFALLATLLTLPGPLAPQDDRAVMAKIQGVWYIDTAEEDGQSMPKERRQKTKITITGSRFKIEEGTAFVEGALKIDASGTVKQFDAFAEVPGSKLLPILGIYKLDANSLTVCFRKARQRPEEFKTKIGDGAIMFVAKRQIVERVPD